MGLLDFLKPKHKADTDYELPIRKRLEQVTTNAEQLEERNATSFQYYTHLSMSESEKSNYILDTKDISGKGDLLFLSTLLPQLHERMHNRDRIQIALITNLFREYPLAKTEFTDEELYVFIKSWKESKDSSFQWTINRLFGQVTKKIEENGLTDVLKQALLLFQTPEEYSYSELRKVNEKIEYLLQGRSSLPVNKHDAWGAELEAFIEGLPTKEKEAWTNLLFHCIEAGEKSSPSKSWQQKAEKLVQEVGTASFVQKLGEWLAFVGQMIQAVHQQKAGFMNERQGFLRDINHNLLKSLIWCAGLVNDSALNTALDAYAAIAYKKKPGVGPVSAKTGTACMYAFSLQPFKEAVTRLMKFRNKIVNNTILKSIDKIISGVAERHGYDKELVEEIGVMDFGLDEEGRKVLEFDNVRCTVGVDRAGQVQTIWSKEGKELKSVPAAVKSSYGAALKDLKKEVTELTAQLQVQKDRIESYYLRKKKWAFAEWQEYYLHHPLVKLIAGKLIWSFTTGDHKEAGFYNEGRIVDAKGEPLKGLTEDTFVELWHPIHATLDEVVGWRNFIQEREITQPFKQAYRELYLLTDAELNTRTYSNRFAAHVLRQHQFAALCKHRDWRYHLMGNWDSHNTPAVYLPHWNLMAQFYVDADWNGVTNDAGIFLYITTDQVRFYGDGEQLELVDVPRLVFSEIMRDVDLFVGVTSIGNDPGWSDSGNDGYNTYWRAYSFGDLSESAKVRSEVLQQLVPRLKIRDKCSFEGKFLIVKGALRTYKIHMGSGNILMEPNDQYLCIVPAGRSEKDREKIYLPFEGDNLLSIIISKALLLAEDAKITDETIIRQIK